MSELIALGIIITGALLIIMVAWEEVGITPAIRAGLTIFSIVFIVAGSFLLGVVT